MYHLRWQYIQSNQFKNCEQESDLMRYDKKKWLSWIL